MTMHRGMIRMSQRRSLQVLLALSVHYDVRRPKSRWHKASVAGSHSLVQCTLAISILYLLHISRCEHLQYAGLTKRTRDLTRDTAGVTRQATDSSHSTGSACCHAGRPWVWMNYPRILSHGWLDVIRIPSKAGPGTSLLSDTCRHYDQWRTQQLATRSSTQTRGNTGSTRK